MRELDADAADDVGGGAVLAGESREDRIGLEAIGLAQQGLDLAAREQRVGDEADIGARPAFHQVVAGQLVEAEDLLSSNSKAAVSSIGQAGGIAAIGLGDQLRDRLQDDRNVPRCRRR